MHWVGLMGKIVSKIRVNVYNVDLIDFMLCFVLWYKYFDMANNFSFF